ncbi:hypothetical protein C0991_012014 [Blastosporella zonata]|nr:hypothetical protein C0991_012014 [Blastosporella zonata]
MFLTTGSFVRALLLESPSTVWWIFLLLWAVRIATVSLLLRSYIFPSALNAILKHVRIRSISLFSIRGLYIRAGPRIIRIDRVRYSFSFAKGINVRLDGLNIEAGRSTAKPLTRHTRHNRRLTLADFAPSPMAHRLWILVSSAYAVVEPCFRPFIRTGVVAAIRLLIRWLPHLISGLYFEAHSTTATFPDLPGTSVSAGSITFHVNLCFTDLEKVMDTLEPSKPRSVRSKRSYGMAAWRKRFTASFQRTLDRAWGNTQGNASIAIKLHNIAGSTLPTPTPTGKKAQFLHLPGAIDFGASMRFNPREGLPDIHSLDISLNIGDCSLELDTLKLLLQSIKPQQTTPPAELDLSSPAPLFMPLSPGLLSSPGSPGTDTTEGFFSSQSWAMSPKAPSSPTSGFLSSGPMPSSPSSPFLERLSSLLSVLKHASIKVSSVTLSSQNKWGLDPYELKLRDITVASSICNSPSEDAFQKHWLGSRKRVENCDPDTYAFKFSIAQVAVERRTRLDSMRLLTLSKMDIQALVTQWPAPWLTPSTFMAGDPNAPFLAIRTRIGGLDITERLERLRELVAHVEPSIKEEAPPTTSSSLFQMPRIAIEAECGTLRGRIICADTKNAEPLAVELRNNGFVFSVESGFVCDHKDKAPDHVRDSLRMDYKFSFVLEPTLIRVRPRTKMDTCRFTCLRSFDPDFLDEPSILSVESIEISGDGHAIATMEHDVDIVPSVLTFSPILELHISTDAICLEVWNPHVIAALQQLSSIAPAREDRPLPYPKQRPLLDRMPPGISTTVTIPRISVLLASPDISPNDDLDLSRGIALRTGLLINYCSMHSSHAHRFHGLNERTTRRHKLYLPQQKLVDALSAARASVITQNASAHIKISFSDLTLRSAVATQYDADNPYIFERDEPVLKPQEFLCIPNIAVDLCLSGKRGTVSSKAGDTCNVSLVIPEVKATFQLAYVYSAMLAVQCIKSVLPKSSPNHTAKARPASELKVKIKAVVPTVQVMCVLRTQRLVARIDDIEFNAPPDRSSTAQLGNLIVWVCLPHQINKWDDEGGDKWAEFICLRSLHASWVPFHGSPSVSLDGESARMRIPYGYNFADFVTDAIVVSKAIRHLTHITPHHTYTPMPMPEPEGPKHVPRITVRFSCLCLEAEDDPFETNLAVIWRCGQDAAKQRIDRESAFQAKVAAIYQAESQVPSGSTEAEKDYEFGGEHSVSIDEARRRLDEVHALDWTLRLRNLRLTQSRSEESVDQTLRGKHAKKGPGSKVPNLVEVSPRAKTPPLFRVLFNGVFVTIQQPSFPAENLPDFLHKQGDGLPHDTHFSLLVPLHLKFTLSSLHITLRDYPLPLFSIPTTADHTPAWEFSTDLVIAEEMGSDLSVDWFDCTVLEPHHGARDASGFSISVPRTIMPVKTYANPVVHINTSQTTILSWGVSYTPAIQDLMRVIESLTTTPRDSSPAVGFWDKIRLVFHWSFVASFKGEVRFHLKGSRDPYQLDNEGAGFVLTFLGDAKLLIARKNEHRELIQVVSDSMFIAIPNLEHLYPRNQQPSFVYRTPEASKPFRKIIAKVRSGVRFGIGFVLERACGDECSACTGTAFHKKYESRETWVDGITPWIGVKGMVEELHADMHQRDEETKVPGAIEKTLRRKPVYAAEVSLKGLDLRALLAIFKEPLLQDVEMIAPPQRSNYRAHKHLPTTPCVSVWFDSADFVETDWSPSTEPKLHLLPVVTCPQFTYFKKNSVLPHNTTLLSKFGSEGSHSCLLGKSFCKSILVNLFTYADSVEAVPHVQIDITEARISELRRLIKNKRSSGDKSRAHLEKMVTLLQEYVLTLRETESGSHAHRKTSENAYLMPSYTVSPDEWAQFENVYQIHCPKILMDSAIRDVVLQYYYCSRARKGLEYHMATRAVKFIRDQAEAALDADTDSDSEESQERSWEGTDAAQMAASALKKLFKGDAGKPSVELATGRDTTAAPPEEFDALDGWSNGVSLRKSHCCLLIKPQIVMRDEDTNDSIVVAAVQAKLQVCAIMDDNNADDPVSGKVMSRSHASVSGLQTFAPNILASKDGVSLPLEVIIDLRCENAAFDQLVPQTDAIFHYDKFNRLRLRNNVTSVTRGMCGSYSSARDSHLQDETDLVRVHIPRFTVSASDGHFRAISHVVTRLLLFSDAAHKTRLEKLETLLFTYDFTDLASAAKVVANLQVRLGEAHEAQKMAEYNHSRRLEEKEGRLELLRLKAHIFLLSEELNFLFDAIKLAQDRHDDHSDKKSALLLHASSEEISWKMLDDRRELLSKLVVQNIDFHWLSRQDSSTRNELSVRNLQAFDGSRHAMWPEIVSKYDEPANHPLLKRGLFLIASWTVLAPVGGIIIYESFEMSLHPIRLQIDARVGRRIMEYMWPARKVHHIDDDEEEEASTTIDQRMSLDSPRALQASKPSSESSSKGQLAPPLRKLGTSRSFTDLRGSAKKDTLSVPSMNRMHSSESLRKMALLGDTDKHKGKSSKKDDAAEMKTRTSQRSFVLVRISSMNLLLSMVKEGSFECHEARIKTRDLEYRNQTWSFEELVSQFIPSDTSWRGWVKMAFHQPLLPVLPVARELISKTKWIPSSSKTVTQFDIKGPPPKLGRARALSEDDDTNLVRANTKTARAKSKSPSHAWQKGSSRKEPLPHITTLPFSDEPESFAQDTPILEVEKPGRASTGRKRMMSLFTRGTTKGSWNSSGSSVTIRRSEDK